MSKAKERATRKRVVAAKVRAPATKRKLSAKTGFDYSAAAKLIKTVTSGKNMAKVSKELADKADVIKPKTVSLRQARIDIAAANRAKVKLELPFVPGGVLDNAKVHTPSRLTAARVTFIEFEGSVYVMRNGKSQIRFMSPEDRKRYANIIGVRIKDVEDVIKIERARLDNEFESFAIGDAIKVLRHAGYHIVTPDGAHAGTNIKASKKVVKESPR